MTTPDTCASATEHRGAWLVCEATGPHKFCWAMCDGRTHRWPNPQQQEVET